MHVTRPLLLAVLGSAVAAAPAAATDRVVRPSGTDNPSCLAASPCQTIGQGVAVAAAGDRVLIGAGTYAESVQVNKRIALVGAGGGSPGVAPNPSRDSIIQPASAPSASAATALRMTQGGSVSGLRLIGRASAAAAGTGLDLRAASSALPGPGTPFAYSVSGVVAEGSANASATPADRQTAPGADFSAADAAVGSTLPVTIDVADSDFVGHGETAASTAIGGAGLTVRGPSDAPWVDVTVHRSTVRGAEFGASAIDLANGTADPTRTRLTLDQVTVPEAQHGAGLEINDGSTVVVSRSRVVGLTQAIESNSSRPVDLTVRDSVVERVSGLQGSSATEAALRLKDFGVSDYRVHLFGSTLVAEENSTSEPDTAAVVVDLNGAGVKAAIDAHNTVLRGFGRVSTGLRYFVGGGATATTTAERSSIGPVAGTGAGATFTATAPVAGDPRFTNEGGSNFVPLADSPLIDAGTPSVVASGEQDLVGQPRSLDGNFDCASAPDVGAYELAGRTGTPPAVAARASAGRVEAGTRVGFSATASDPDGIASTGWTLPGGATASGLTTSAVLRTPGIAAIPFRATDARGCSASATARVQVDRAVAPRVSGIRLAKRFTAKKGAKLSYRLSEPAVVKLVFERRTGKGRHRRWKKVATVRRAKAPAGATRFTVRRKVGRKALVAGTWRVKLQATDLVGLRSRVATKGFRVIRHRHR